MLMFVWSLVASAIDGARRSRLARLVLGELEREAETGEPRALVLTRRSGQGGGLSRYASAPSLLEDDRGLLLQTDSFRLSLAAKSELSPLGWAVEPADVCLDFLRQHGSPSTALLSSLGFLSRQPPPRSHVFFVATLLPRPGRGRAEERVGAGRREERGGEREGGWEAVEELAVGLGTRGGAGSVGEALLVAETREAFADLLCHAAEGNLLFRRRFQVTAIETVELSAGLLREVLLRSKRKPGCVAVLERLCLDDISAAKALPEFLSPLASALLRRRSLLSSRASSVGSSSRTTSPSPASRLPSPLRSLHQRFAQPSQAPPPPLPLPSPQRLLPERRTTAEPSEAEKPSLAEFEVGASSSGWDSATSSLGGYLEERSSPSSALPSDSAQPSDSAAGTAIGSPEDSFDSRSLGRSLDSPLSAYDHYSLSRERRRRRRSSSRGDPRDAKVAKDSKPPSGRRASEASLPDAAMTEMAVVGPRRMSMLVSTPQTDGLSSSLGLSAGKARRLSMMPPSSLRNRRRSMSPMLMLGEAEEAEGLPSAADGVRGWQGGWEQRTRSFRGSSAGPGNRRRLSSVGNLLGLKPPKTPPNILVYAGAAAGEKAIGELKGLVERSVRAHSHAVHVLDREALLRQPWRDNAACLIVVDTDTLDDRAWARVEDYFRSSKGRVLFVCQNRLLASLAATDSSKGRLGLLKLAFQPSQGRASALPKDFHTFMKKVSKGLSKPHVSETFHAKDLVGGYKYAISVVREAGTPLILYMQTGAKDAGGALFSDATLENLLEEGSNLIREGLERLSLPISPREDPVQPTAGELLIPTSKAELQWKICLSKGHLEGDREGKPSEAEALPKGQPVDFLTEESSRSAELLAEGRLPVTLATEDCEFRERIYFGRLGGKGRLGQRVLWVPVARSTQEVALTLARGGRAYEDVVVVAGSQTAGRGRGTNRWLSPEGAALFSFPLHLPLTSRLASAPDFIQHLLCLATAEAVGKLLKGSEDFPLGIKWPNDLFYLKLHKLGGVLVWTERVEGELRAVCGVGLNVENGVPTVCVNDLTQGVRLKVEEVVAETVKQMEGLVGAFQEGGPGPVASLYYRHWLHSREELVLEDSGEKVVVRGLDAQGHLQVRSKSTGKLLSLRPDGNSFDSFKGLRPIAPQA